MKELSIEDKAKRYDKALERMKSWAKGEHPECFGEAQKAAEFVFPELKESEDERIRKDMIETIKQESKDFPSSVIAEKSNSWIAWLEKQGVQKPQGKSAFEAAKEEKVDNQNCVKPADKPKFKGGDIISDGISEVKIVSIDKNNYNVTNGEIENDAHAGNWVVYFKDQDNWKLVEQKPTDKVEQDSCQWPTIWCEEDERKISLLEALCDDQINGSTSYSTMYREMHELKDWLKSLKERVQPKQEWSEEDENTLNSIINYLEEVSGRIALPNLKENYIRQIDWLKSLKPQNTWKSSDKHYELEEFVNIVRDNLAGISRIVIERLEAKYLQLTGNKMYEISID